MSHFSCLHGSHRTQIEHVIYLQNQQCSQLMNLPFTVEKYPWRRSLVSVRVMSGFWRTYSWSLPHSASTLASFYLQSSHESSYGDQKNKNHENILVLALRVLPSVHLLTRHWLIEWIIANRKTCSKKGAMDHRDKYLHLQHADVPIWISVLLLFALDVID